MNMKGSLLAAELDPAFKRRARIILENLNMGGVERVLDLGCGRGFYLSAISQLYPRAEVVGIDSNFKYIEMAKKITKGRVIAGDATKLPFSDDYFDRIICSEVLEHIADDNQVIFEMRRVLKQDGYVLISVPNKNYPFWLDPINYILERKTGYHVPSNIWWLAGIWADHVRLYGETEIIEKLEGAGLKVKRVWRATRWGMILEHFLLYAIGKNIVEMGWLGQFNRFNTRPKNSRLLMAVLAVLGWFDRKNDTIEAGPNDRFVNIVVKASR